MHVDDNVVFGPTCMQEYIVNTVVSPFFMKVFLTLKDERYFVRPTHDGRQ